MGKVKAAMIDWEEKHPNEYWYREQLKMISEVDIKDMQDDNVNHPKHYTSHPSGIEAITITEHMSFTLGNALKYIWRADLKNGVEDLKKAAWYINREIEKRAKEVNACPF